MDSTDIAAIEHAFSQWREANCAGDIDRLCSLYHPKAIFWGTISPFLRTTPEEVRDYFKLFLSPPPFKILHHHEISRVYGDVGLISGSYTFYFPQVQGIRHIDGRFSFAYHREADGRWLIIDHHSSRIPGSV